MRVRLIPVLALLLCPGALCADQPTPFDTPIKLAPNEAVVTVIGTNDVHGGVEPSVKDGQRLGGYDWFAGYVAAVRAHVNKVYGEQGQTLLLDAGDAASGTLLSNFTEGMLLASLMNRVGYNASIPGNHAYDYGPIGWLFNIVTPGKTDDDPLGALRRFIRALSFPCLAANVTKNGNP